MTDKKFTNDDIIKAAECCANDDYPASCHVCPFKGERCSQIMPKAVAEILKNQKEDNERLYNENEALISAQETLQKHINRQNKEIERLKNSLAISKKEIERLQKYNTYVAYKHYNDGIKEFAKKTDEMITEIYNKHIFGNNDLYDEEKEAIMNFSDDIVCGFDNLVKEMVGDSE